MTYLVITAVGPGGEETSIEALPGHPREWMTYPMAGPTPPLLAGSARVVLARRAEQGPCWPVARVAVYADLSQSPVQEEYEIEVPGARGGGS